MVQRKTEEEEQVDIQKVLGEIAELEKKEAETKEKLNGYLTMPLADLMLTEKYKEELKSELN